MGWPEQERTSNVPRDLRMSGHRRARRRQHQARHPRAQGHVLHEARSCRRAHPGAQSLMGHQSVEMTANIYTRVTIQNLRDALRVVPPLEGAGKDDKEGLTQRACRSNS
ncbi:MAG: integrase [Planctomycetota bacterium]|jgi:integrase